MPWIQLLAFGNYCKKTLQFLPKKLSTAYILSKKFAILFTLCSNLLTKNQASPRTFKSDPCLATYTLATSSMITKRSYQNICPEPTCLNSWVYMLYAITRTRRNIQYIHTHQPKTRNWNLTRIKSSQNQMKAGVQNNGRADLVYETT